MTKHDKLIMGLPAQFFWKVQKQSEIVVWFIEYKCELRIIISKHHYIKEKYCKHIVGFDGSHSSPNGVS